MRGHTRNFLYSSPDPAQHSLLQLYVAAPVFALTRGPGQITSVLEEELEKGGASRGEDETVVMRSLQSLSRSVLLKTLALDDTASFSFSVASATPASVQNLDAPHQALATSSRTLEG